MMDFHFLRPYWLLSLLPVIIIWLGFLRKQDELQKIKKLIDPHLVEHLLVGEHKRVFFKPVNILPVFLVVSALALAGPSFRQEKSPFIDDQAGLMILLKVAPTMNSKDVQPSRLDRAKHKIRDLIDLRSGAATGLIVYSGSAHLVMPLTKDDRIINTMIEDLTPELMPVQGDALAAAIELAERVIVETGQAGSLLVMADSVSEGQAAPADCSLPVQFLSLLPPGIALDKNLKQTASGLDADVVELTVDSADVEKLSRRAKTSFSAVKQDQEGQRWKDEGYWLLPVIACLFLLWFRKGWVVA